MGIFVQSNTNRNRKGKSDILLISDPGLIALTSRVNFEQFYTERVSVLADLTLWRSPGESASLLCNVENVDQRTRSRKMQEYN